MTRLAPLLAVLGVIVCASSIVISATGSPSDAAFGRGLLELLIVGVPIAGGIYALHAPANAGFGIALLAIGFFWSFTALGQTSASVPYTIGRLATWCVFPGVIYLLLAFPNGRIAAGLDRVLFVGILGVIVLLFFGTAPLVEAYPPKTLWATCTTDCPPNALFALDHTPAFLPKLILVREWLVELLWLGVFWSMYRRSRAASPLQRRALVPVFTAGALLGLSHIGHITYRELGGPTDTVIALSSAWTVAIVGVCATFVFGLMRRRTGLASALSTLGSTLHSSPPRDRMRDALATATHDSTIEALFRDGDGSTWHDSSGRRVPWPPPERPSRAVTTIGGNGTGAAVALVHDVALTDDQELLEGVSGIVFSAYRHERLVDDLAGAMRDLGDSRRRIAEASVLTRVQIERDLHDGAQQRLVALRIRLGMAEELLPRDQSAGIEAVRELGSEVELALEELRSVAQGVFPSLLADRGLAYALRSLACDSPLPIHLSTDGVGRHPVEIESAVYFTCVEAVQNAAKHAAGASGTWITLKQSSDVLRFEVRDDGAGFALTQETGRGLRDMRDRIEAVSGRLTIDTAPGAGTRVAGGVELSRPARVHAPR